MARTAVETIGSCQRSGTRQIAFRPRREARRFEPRPIPARACLPHVLRVLARVDDQRTRRGESSRISCHHPRFGFFQEGNDLISGHGGKALEKRVDRFPGFQIVEKRLNGNAGSRKYWRSSQDMG